VVGRAGREAGAGYGYLQTHQPEHPVIRALIAQDRDAFYDAEIEQREKAHYPPFGRLASLVVSGEDRHESEAYARALARAAPKVEGAKSDAAMGDEVRVLGPAEAPLALIRGRHRLRLLVKAPRAFDLSAYLRDWLAAGPKPKGSIKLEIDIDPQSFL
jgi:primosomal protein N' (replication factor Y) (superfamily II helicase)